jgi:alginate O-acetyltransferase complex protein AlgI
LVFDGMKFNFFSSLSFWLALCGIIVVIRFFDRKAAVRRYLLLVSSVLMILCIPSFTPLNLACLLILSAFSYLVSHILNRGAASPRIIRRQLVSALGVLGVLGFLAFYKYRFIQALFFGGSSPAGNPSPRIVFMIGVSYFSFRMIHFIIESYRKKVDEPSFLDYLIYIMFFPSFISGPINRFSPFGQQLRPAVPSRLGPDLREGGERIVHGLFKKFVLAQVFYPHILTTTPDLLAQTGPAKLILGLYAYAFYFYFDFAGYTDLALGCARLIGLELPENFNNPFLRRNIRELWTNWHMSLTSWLVDYIYWPIVRRFRGLDYFRRHPIFLSNLGMIITFIACGMWHGESANFILWGGYHGVGIAVLTIYQRQKRKVRSAVLQRYFRSWVSTVIGVLVTFNFFALGLAFFVLDLEKLRLLAGSVLSRF